MESTRKHLEQQQPQHSSLGQDLKRLHADGSASAAELRQFLGQLKGRSPDEVMGVVAQSSLVQSLLTATIGCLAIVLVGTLIPYGLGLAFPEPAKELTASTPSSQPAGDASSAPNEGETATTSTGTGTPGEVDLEKAAEAMGIGGAAEAAPDVNPLDKKLENLLDGVE